MITTQCSPPCAPVRGYMLKGAQQDEIVRAIEAVAAGEAIFGPGIARRGLALAFTPPAPGVPFHGLTSREREVLSLIAAAYATQRSRRATHGSTKARRCRSTRRRIAPRTVPSRSRSDRNRA